MLKKCKKVEVGFGQFIFIGFLKLLLFCTSAFASIKAVILQCLECHFCSLKYLLGNYDSFSGNVNGRMLAGRAEV